MRYALELTLFMLMTSVCAHAQPTVYRCGNSFSDVPCPEEPARPAAPPADAPAVQRALPSTPDFASEPEIIAAAKAACMARLKTDIAFVEPESVQIGAVERRMPWNTLIDGKPVSARMYVMQVNAKNALGKYSGDWPFICNMDLAELEVLNIVAPVACSAPQQPNCTYVSKGSR